MTRKYSKRSLNSLQGIHPDLRRVIDRALRDSPIDFVVIEGLRTVARQRQMVAQGSSKTMNSRHITGHAVDLMPIGPDGKGSFDWPLYHVLGPAVEAAAVAEGVKITWGGRWKSFKDGPHFELGKGAYPASAWTTGMAVPAGTTVVLASIPAQTPAEAAAPRPVAAPPAMGWLAGIMAAMAAFFTRSK